MADLVPLALILVMVLIAFSLPGYGGGKPPDSWGC